jgi:hypothetical protein
MSAVIEWRPLWLRVALAGVGFLLGSIVALAACQAAKVLGAMAIEAGFNAAAHLTNRLTRVFVEWGCGMARGVGLSVRALARAVRGGLARQRQARKLRRLWHEEFREHFETFAAFRDAFGRAATPERTAQRERPSSGATPRREEQARPKPPPSPPPPRNPPPDPDQAALNAACRMLGLPESGFTPEQLSKCYRVRMHAAHPDRGGSHRHAAALNAARDLIKKRKGWT